MTGGGHEGTFWSDGNVTYLDWYPRDVMYVKTRKTPTFYYGYYTSIKFC